jgi:hypothetical protein
MVGPMIDYSWMLQRAEQASDNELLSCFATILGRLLAAGLQYGAKVEDCDFVCEKIKLYVREENARLIAHVADHHNAPESTQ